MPVKHLGKEFHKPVVYVSILICKTYKYLVSAGFDDEEKWEVDIAEVGARAGKGIGKSDWVFSWSFTREKAWELEMGFVRFDAYISPFSLQFCFFM